MKNYFKLAVAAMIGSAALGLTSCSSDNSDPTPTPQTSSKMKDIVTNYVDNIVNATYQDLAKETQTLYDACQNLHAKKKSGQLTQADIDAACTAFKSARKYWEQSEAFLYGAASDNEIDPHIDSWPLDHDQLVKALTSNEIIAGINGSNPDKFIYEKNGAFDSVLGFHGLEFILFRNGANRTLSSLNAANETEPGLTSVTTLDEIAFAAAVSGDLRNMVFLLEYGWMGSSINANHMTQLSNAKWVLDGTRYAGLSKAGVDYGTYVKGATTSKGMFTTWHETLQNIFIGGCSNICQEVYTQKLGQAYRVANGTGTSEDAANYIESPYSKRSFQDYQDNLYSIKNSLYGVRGTENVTTPADRSIMAYLKEKGYPKYDALNTALNEAIASLETAKKSGIAFIDQPGHPQVKTCIDKIQALDEALNEAGSWINRLPDE